MIDSDAPTGGYPRQKRFVMAAAPPLEAETGKDLDLLCAGRICVDLYAEQEGAALADVTSFRKYIGGSAANIAVGAARLGLRSAMLTRVGDEPFGHFLLRRLRDEGVDIEGVRLDPERLSGLVTLAVRESDDFPRLFFYRDVSIR